MKAFLHKNIDKLEKWFLWYCQQEEQGMFVWWSDSSKSRPFLGTGLDDYPRSLPGQPEQFSLDLQVWMTAFAKLLSEMFMHIDMREKAQ